MESRHIFLIITFLAIGIIGIPSVYSLFTGQHDWYDTGLSDDPFDQYSIPCQKCHGDVRQELESSSIHQTFRCINCHVDMNSNESHINFVAPRCLDCHATGREIVDSNGELRIAPIADVFGDNVTSKEVHIPFVDGARSTQLHKGENEACIACHTRKSLTISWTFFDTYRFRADRLASSTWLVSNFSKKAQPGVVPLINATESAGKHSWTAKSQMKYKCEKCHSNIRAELNISKHHTNFGCFSCHQLYSNFHAASIPPCIRCHGSSPETVTDLNGNSFTAPTAPLYSGTISGPEPHIPFVLGANSSSISTDKNAACASCHSSFKNNITFTRPSYVEWDVVSSGDNWLIRNLVIGPIKEVNIFKNLDGKVHNISNVEDVNCVACHQDIRQAVLSGGHTVQRWAKDRQSHNPNNYANINDYCKACHRPSTRRQDSGTSPFPAPPFNSLVHNAVTIACFDCHNKTGQIEVYLNGGWNYPPFRADKMGNIQNSISQQPAYIRSYMCVACKIVSGEDNKPPEPNVHFKVITEPEIIVYVNGQQRYP